MPAPWYRHGRAGPACCCGPPEVSSLALQARSEVEPRSEVQSLARDDCHFGPEPLSPQVADVLDWLARYDFRELEGPRHDFQDRSNRQDPVPPDRASLTEQGEATLPGEPAEAWGGTDDVCDEFAQDRPKEDCEGADDDPLLQVPKIRRMPPQQGLALNPIRKSPTPAGKPATGPVKSVRQASVDTDSPRGCEFLDNCGCPSSSSSAANSRDFLEDEEEEWERRRLRGGTVGRLVIYREGESPKEDVVLRGGGRRHIVVAGLREGGQAAKVGVRAGDRLVSIDGRKGFVGLPASQVQEGLRSPTVLVFVGFVGKLQAEVRLARGNDAAGVPAKTTPDIKRDGGAFKLCEQRVFDVGSASLFLTVHAAAEDSPTAEAVAAERTAPSAELDGPGARSSEAEPRRHVQQPSSLEEDEDADAALPARGRPGAAWPIFELQRVEANSLVKGAMRRLRFHELEESSEAGMATPVVEHRGVPGLMVPKLNLASNQDPVSCNHTDSTGSLVPPLGSTLRV